MAGQVAWHSHIQPRPGQSHRLHQQRAKDRLGLSAVCGRPERLPAGLLLGGRSCQHAPREGLLDLAHKFQSHHFTRRSRLHQLSHFNPFAQRNQMKSSTSLNRNAPRTSNALEQSRFASLKSKLVRVAQQGRSRGKFTVSIYDDHLSRADADAHAGGGG